MSGLALSLVSILLALPPETSESGPQRPFEILVLDPESRRGVPLIELRTVHGVRFYTDSSGRIAIDEPGWRGRDVFFFVSGHGYRFPEDGFGMQGRSLRIEPGKKAVLEIERRNVAVRLYRITGEGIHHHTRRLGLDTPRSSPAAAGRVAGQDSTFAVPFRDRIYWFWGDTVGLQHPLGHFWMAAATSPGPGKGQLDPERGIPLEYFTDASGFSRPVCRLGVKSGLIWADAFVALPDASGEMQLACHHVHLESISKILGHGVSRFDESAGEFVRVKDFGPETRWCWPPQAHPVRHRVGDRDLLLLGEVFPTSRVEARLESFFDPTAFEAFTCLEPGSSSEKPVVARTASGEPRWRWTRDAPPVDIPLEARLLDSGKLLPSEARYHPLDVETGDRIELHRGSIQWNEHRGRWILIAVQRGGTSNLGEVWYSESPSPTGPWKRARKVVTHDRYSFYNPVHHAFLDRDGGRFIYFEGTYTDTFSGAPFPTPRYNYNQILYRLDLDDPRLQSLRD